MSTQITASSKIYIGLDIHKNTWTVSIQSDLFFHKTYSMPSKSSDLYDYVSKNFPQDEIHLVYEAGCCGFSVARYFLNLGWNVLVVNPADVKTGDKQKYQKTDSLDARNLSNQLKAGTLVGINIPTEAEDQFTSLARHRTQVTKKLRQTKSHIKSLLLFHGIEIPVEYDNSNWSNGFIEWLSIAQLSH
jgi:transposase